jgi:1,2-diacylglycerol 3-beta-glucosyltransferase
MPAEIATVATFLLALPAIYITTVSAYLFVLTLGSMLYRPRTAPDAPDQRIALMIPAHNEQHGIEAVVSVALGLDYPADQRDVFVIADNCDDDTVAIAEKAEAIVFERHDTENRGKGQALDWCLNTHRDTLSKYDIIAFVDADMAITPNFLSEIAARFADTNVKIVQTMNMVSNPDANWRSALGFMSFAVVNHVRPAGRCWLGGTGELKGSGMAFRSALLLDYGWPAHTIAEDSEFGKQLLLDGHRVTYAPGARVTSDIPTHAVQVQTQQSRWEGGKMYLVKKYIPLFFKRLMRRPSMMYLDALLDTVVPPLTILVALTLVCGAVALVTVPTLAILFALDLTLIALTIAAALTQLRAPVKVWLYIATIPVFMAWKLPLLFKVFTGKTETGWARTPRDEELD